MAVRNNNPMPYNPRTAAEAQSLLDELTRDRAAQLRGEAPNWDHLGDLDDWIAETKDLIDQLELSEWMER